MQAPSINSVKEQFEAYRQSRSYRKQPVPDEIISNLKALSKSIPISKLQREFKLSESILKRIREPKNSGEVIRLAPVTFMGPSNPLMVEVVLPRGETICIRGLSAVSEVAELLRILREA